MHVTHPGKVLLYARAYTHGIPVGKFDEISVGAGHNTYLLSVSNFNPRGVDNLHRKNYN